MPLRQFLLDFYHDRTFSSTLMKIAIPIILQNLISSSLNMIDTIMIGRVGTVELAAVGVATQFFFFNIVALVGGCSGYCIFIAQYWGRQDIASIKKYLGIILLYALGVGLLFSLIGFFFAEKIILLFNDDPNVVRLGAVYIRTLAFGTFFSGLTYAFGFASRSIENAFLPMIASTIALVTNTFLNYVLIFGHFGAPALGVEGAALATLFARILEAAIILVYVYGKRTPLAVKPSDFDFHPAFLLQDWRTVLPVMLNELCWGLATIVYTAAYGRIDTDALASIQIANTVQNLFLIFGMGVSGATATMVGNTIGRGLTKRAETYAYRSILLCMVIGVLLTVVIIISAPLFIWFYHLDSAQVANDALLMIRILALSMPVKLVNITVIMGVLRAGGDVVFSLLFESCTMWFIGVPLAFIGALALKWPVYLVYALVIVEEVIKFVLCLWRSFSGKWMKILV